MALTITSAVNKMMWAALVIGLIVGGGGGAGIMHAIHKKKNVPAQPATALEQVKLQQQLTDLDLVKPVCTPEFITQSPDGSLLCRELFCRMQQRGVDAKTSQVDCSNIGNMLNKSALYRFCSNSSKNDKDVFRACIELYDRRL